MINGLPSTRLLEMAPAHTCEGCVLAGADERDRPVSSRQERAFALMNEDGSLSPHDRSLDRNPGSTCLPKDSFKDDIQVCHTRGIWVWRALVGTTVHYVLNINSDNMIVPTAQDTVKEMSIVRNYSELEEL